MMTTLNKWAYTQRVQAVLLRFARGYRDRVSCPHCSTPLSGHQVLAGFHAAADITTECPRCHHRFVAWIQVGLPDEKYNIVRIVWMGKVQTKAALSKCLDAWDVTIQGLPKSTFGHFVEAIDGLIKGLQSTDIPLLWNIFAYAREGSTLPEAIVELGHGHKVARLLAPHRDDLNTRWHTKATDYLLAVPVSELDPLADILDLDCDMSNATLLEMQAALQRKPILCSAGPDPTHDYNHEEDEEDEDEDEDEEMAEVPLIAGSSPAAIPAPAPAVVGDKRARQRWA